MNQLSLDDDVQHETDRRRADRKAVAPAIHVFISHTKAQWPSMLAELRLALEGLYGGLDVRPIAATETRKPSPDPAFAGKAPDSLPTSTLSPPKMKREYSDLVLEMLTKNGPDGATPAQLALSAYGNEKATEKVRAIIWHLVKKRGMSIHKAKSDGRWRLTSPASEPASKERNGPSPSSVKRTSARGQVLTWMAEKGGVVSVEELRASVDVKPGKLAHTIYDLSAKRHGWIVREQDGWKITPAGRAMLP